MMYVIDDRAAARVRALGATLMDGEHLPRHVERARVVNAAEPTTAFLAYWTDPAEHDRWLVRSDVDDLLNGAESTHITVETATIPADRWETLHSTDVPTPGVRQVLDVAVTDVHEYWGAARDRIAASASCSLTAVEGSVLPENMCLIRSGQVWQACDALERNIYAEQVEPRLAEGIDFLRSAAAQAAGTGCYTARYLREQTMEGDDLDSTSFVGWFRDLGALEAWSRTHPTHLAIFDAFMGLVTLMQGRVELRLWHEVASLPAGAVAVSGHAPSPLLDALRL